jgi:hypothetical protein
VNSVKNDGPELLQPDVLLAGCVDGTKQPSNDEGAVTATAPPPGSLCPLSDSGTGSGPCRPLWGDLARSATDCCEGFCAGLTPGLHTEANRQDGPLIRWR